MLATLAEHSTRDAAFVYEPKYDGIRALAAVEPGGSDARVALYSRLGNEKSSQFPEIVTALAAFAKGRPPLVLDGEIVALDRNGEPAGFQQLQGRIHVTSGAPGGQAVAFIVFDILREGDDDLCGLPLTERRARLERVFGRTRSPVIRLGEQVHGDGEALWDEARTRGWEGLIAKRASSPYRAGKRSPDWMKLKLVVTQEFVVGGWTEPRGSRSHFGALLLGVYDGDALEYVGHTGAGFDGKELDKVSRLLRPLETATSPFRVRPKPNERPHWVEPSLVAEVKFTEWTDDGKLRHPTYLGLRDDVDARKVTREQKAPATRTAATPARRHGAGQGSKSATTTRRPSVRQGVSPTKAREPHVKQGPSTAKTGRASAGPGSSPAMTREPDGGRVGPVKTPKRRSNQKPQSTKPVVLPPELSSVVEQLQDLEDRGKDGPVLLPDGDRLDVTNLRKVFWPGPRLTKGDLLRYYVRVAPVILPVVEDRPLVMKRLPNGVDGKAFYQQRAPSPVPAHVRVEELESDTDVPNRLIGGNLKTLLYMAQIAAISQDPWFSRVQSPADADCAAIDLDPGDGVTFETVLDVARWVRDELAVLGAESYPKTSGSDGLHVFLPLPPGTPYEAGMLYCQIVATMVATKHPRQATVERTVRARPKGTVYVDYLQNIEGKTLACAYSARGSDYAGASTPLTWDEVDQGVDRRDYTILTLPERLAEVGDLWKGLRASKGIDFHAVERYLKK
jgi:bifunctional non-homologous end joining protein LigD